MQEKELLDFCRVKKIFDKGFGFLTSLYYDQPVFFHFNKVKDPAVKEKLEKLKRGEVYFFYTSILYKEKRRVYKLWLNVKDIEENLIPDFVDRLIYELNEGKINVFEIAYVIKHLRENDFINKEKFTEILNSNKMLKTPSVLKAVLKDDEKDLSDVINALIEKLETKEITDGNWSENVLSTLNT